MSSTAELEFTTGDSVHSTDQVTGDSVPNSDPVTGDSFHSSATTTVDSVSSPDQIRSDFVNKIEIDKPAVRELTNATNFKTIFLSADRSYPPKSAMDDSASRPITPVSKMATNLHMGMMADTQGAKMADLLEDKLPASQMADYGKMADTHAAKMADTPAARKAEPPANEVKGRSGRQLDRTDSLLSGSGTPALPGLPLHEPTGEKTRRTYDLTQVFHVGLSCHDIQATQVGSLT